MGPIFQSLQKKTSWERLQLTEAQQRMYAAERLGNFRWICKMVANYSNYELKEEDIVPEELTLWLREIGQFAEVMYATPPLETLLKHYDSINKPGFPFEGYYALSPHPYPSSALPLSRTQRCSILTSSGVRLLKTLKGSVAKLPAAIFLRWIHEHGCTQIGPTPCSQKASAEPKRGDKSCTCARRRQQIIVSICGTASVQQAIQDLRAIRKVHPGVPDTAATVHTGFWDLYQGMKPALMEGIEVGLRTDPAEDEVRSSEGRMEGDDDDVIQELVVTGHSMGGAIAHLLCLDLLLPVSSSRHTRASSSALSLKPSRSNGLYGFPPPPPPPRDLASSPMVEPCLQKCDEESLLQSLGLKSLQIITFGEPRTGNQALVDYWVQVKRRHEEDYGIPIREWCIKGFNDGVPALPLITLGYRHFAQKPLYAINGKLYRIPPSEREFALFRVASSSGSGSPNPSSEKGPDRQQSGEVSVPCTATLAYQASLAAGSPSMPLSPLGGHNYYNERDLEGGFLRRMDWLMKSGFDKEGWEEKYRTIMEKHLV